MLPPFSPLAPDDPAEIGGYRLVARLGEGGMGLVYLAATQSGRRLAIKVIRREHAANPEFRRRFAQEIAAVQRVQSLYTAPIIDADTESAVPWLATAYVPGPSLAAAVAGHGPLPTGAVLMLVCGVAEALQAIHAAKVVHRDLKPSNVLLAPDGPRVIDFGIAKAVDATPLTATHIHIGTPQFMAPEQALGHPATPEVDVFALGGLMVYAATGVPPFGEGHPQAVLYRIINNAPHLDGCSPQVRSLAERCLSKDPAQRPHPRDLIEELRPHADGAPGQAWPPPAIAPALPTYANPPAPPPAIRARGASRAGLALGAIATAAVVAAAVTIIRQDPGDETPRSQAALTAPADTSAGPSPAAKEVRAAKGPGSLVGNYKGIDLTDDYSLYLLDDPRHPVEGSDGDVAFFYFSTFEEDSISGDQMSVLDDGQPGTYQACVDNTRYAQNLDVKDIMKRRVCIYTERAIGLVKITKLIKGPSRYLTLDLTVWRR